LPRAEIGLPALLVEISEYQEQKDRDRSRNYDRGYENIIHRARKTLLVVSPGATMKGSSYLMVSH
jgi:hypothetical protein